MNKVNAMFPGSFNPIHKGHLDIIKRASKLFAKLYVVVSNNAYKPAISCKKRLEKAQKEIDKLRLKNVVVLLNKDLTVKFARKHNISVIVRSIRNTKDATYEIDIAKTNHYLDKKIETILMLPSDELAQLSSTAIRYIKDVKKNK